jgi:hypothetical protein
MCRFEYSLYILGRFELLPRRGCARVAFWCVVQAVHGAPVAPREQVPELPDYTGSRGQKPVTSSLLFPSEYSHTSEVLT